MRQIEKYRDYSALFTRSEISEVLQNNFQSVLAKIYRNDKNWLNKDNATYLDYLKHAYKNILKNYQNEYVLKNEFLNQWLLAELGSSDSIVFSEFRIGKSIADLAMFNGVSKVFEIKSELDTDNRLNKQIINYRSVFNEIYVIVPSSKEKHYTSTLSEDIGIISYSLDSFKKFELLRAAQYSLNVSPEVLMNVLHTNEYRSIVEAYYSNIPPMTAFTQYDICLELVKNIPQSQLNSFFIEKMKSRKQNVRLSSFAHQEFNQLKLALKMNDSNWGGLLRNLKSQIKP